jgi:hypothetical protein
VSEREDRRGPLRRTLLSMGVFALLIVGLWQLDSRGLLADLPADGLLVLVVVVGVLTFAVSLYRGDHRRERKYPLGTGLSRDTPDPSDFEDDTGETDDR